MNFRAPHNWTFPVPIAYGPGRLAEIADHCRDAGMTNPLIVTDRGSANLPFISALAGHLDRTTVFAEISPNPRDTEIAAGRAVFRTGDHDGIIAIGGGSGMDGGKAIALTARNEIDLFAFEFEQMPPDTTDFPPLITIPTTAGTGAETESTAMITDTRRMMKWCVWHAALKPRVAVLDPELTVALPAHLTAWTGIDAMVHAIEAYLVPDTNPFCDGMALEGLRLVWDALPTAYAEPANIEARGAMLTGSCLAGVAFQKGLGLVHAISHMVGAEYDTQHGLTNAILLPAVLRFNAPTITDRIAPMTQAMSLPATDFETFHTAICTRLDALSIPRTLSEIGVPTDGINSLATKALEDSAAGTNPRPATAAQIETILTEALTTGR